MSIFNYNWYQDAYLALSCLLTLVMPHAQHFLTLLKIHF